MKKVLLKSLKKGDFFRFKESESSPVWVRDFYDRSTKKYAVHKFEDVNLFSLRSGSIFVYTDFIF